MKILGVNELICGSFPTFCLEFNEDLNKEIISVVEDKNIDLVYTHWSGDIHHDHIALARSTLHACRHVPRLLMYRSNWYHSTEDFRGNFYQDISSVWEIKKNAILAHQSELKRTHFKWIEFFENEAINAGQRIGTEKAEVFSVVKWLNST